MKHIILAVSLLVGCAEQRTIPSESLSEASFTAQRSFSVSTQPRFATDYNHSHVQNREHCGRYSTRPCLISPACLNPTDNTHYRVKSYNKSALEDYRLFTLTPPFEQDSARLTVAVMHGLDQFSEHFLANNRMANVITVGHTNDIGDANYNQTLSEKRAKAVASYLSLKGIPSSKIQSLGLGEVAPLRNISPAYQYQLNRRVEIVTFSQDGRTYCDYLYGL